MASEAGTRRQQEATAIGDDIRSQHQKIAADDDIRRWYPEGTGLYD